MAYQTIPLKVVSGTSESRSQQANSEHTKNWYPEATPGGRSGAILLPWPGAIAFSESGGSIDRGLHVFKEELYHVSSNKLYKISSTGYVTEIGTIEGDSRCIFDDNGKEMVIATTGYVYSYNGTALVRGDAAEFRDTSAVTMLNNTFIYDGLGDDFFVSEAGDALDFRASGSAESRGDTMVRPYAFGQWVYMMCKRSIEPWWNAATDTLGFDRIDNAIVEKGLGGIYTVANSDQFMYFLGDDSNVYQVAQSAIRQISTTAISYQIGKLDISTATGWTMTLDGQDFYILNFGENDLSYAYSEQTGLWFNLSTGVNNGRYLASSYARVYGKHLVVDYRTSNIVELSNTAYSDLGETIQRVRVLPPLNSSNLGQGAGLRLLMSKAKFILQTGQGLPTGQGSDPAIEVEYSIDGGATWALIDWPKVGRLGQYLVKVEAWKMVSFYDIQFRLTMADPVFSSLHDGSIDIKQAGY